MTAFGCLLCAVNLFLLPAPRKAQIHKQAARVRDAICHPGKPSDWDRMPSKRTQIIPVPKRQAEVPQDSDNDSKSDAPPVAAQASADAEAPVAAQEPAGAEAPAAAQEPTGAEAPVTAQEPAGAEAHAAAQAPADAEAPAVAQEPTGAEAPAAAQAHAAAQETPDAEAHAAAQESPNVKSADAAPGESARPRRACTLSCYDVLLALVNGSLFFFPTLKLLWLSLAVVRYVWIAGQPYLCGVIFVHDMDVVGVMVHMSNLYRDQYGRYSWQALKSLRWWEAASALIWLGTGGMYYAVNYLGAMVYVWVSMVLAIITHVTLCALGQWRSVVRPTSRHPTQNLPAMSLLAAYYKLQPVLLSPEARLFTAREKRVLLVHLALMQVSVLGQVLLAGPCVQLLAGANYITAFQLDFEQRSVAGYFGAALDGFRANAVSILSYVL